MKKQIIALILLLMLLGPMFGGILMIRNLPRKGTGETKPDSEDPS